MIIDVIACKKVAAKKKGKINVWQRTAASGNKKEQPGKKYIEITVGTLPTQYGSKSDSLIKSFFLIENFFVHFLNTASMSISRHDIR